LPHTHPKGYKGKKYVHRTKAKSPAKKVRRKTAK